MSEDKDIDDDYEDEVDEDWDPIAELQEAEQDVNELVNQLGYIAS